MFVNVFFLDFVCFFESNFKCFGFWIVFNFYYDCFIQIRNINVIFHFLVQLLPNFIYTMLKSIIKFVELTNEFPSIRSEKFEHKSCDQ